MSANKEALQAGFEDFSRNGYVGDLEHFTHLMKTNQEARDSAYEGFVKTGYVGDKDHFNGLMGASTGGGGGGSKSVKKKGVVTPKKISIIQNQAYFDEHDKDKDGFYDNTQTEVKPKNVLNVSDDILGDILNNTTEKDEVVKPPAPHITNEQLVDYIRPGMDIMENYRNMDKEYGMVNRLKENYEGEGLTFEVRDEFGPNDSVIATNARGETFRIDTSS